MEAGNFLAERGIYNTNPPPLQTAQDDHATLLVSWWCTGFALVAILIRVCGRYIRTEMLFREDKTMFWSIIPLLIRMALVHVILIWGTNNTVTTGLTETDIYHREIGSRLVLAARIFYALFIWIAKFTILEFLKRLIGPMAWQKSYELGMRLIEAFLVLTFVAVVIATLAECQPFSHYWQVVPDPGPHCRMGYAQLITMGTADIITDLVLVIFPIPLVLMSTMQMTRKISLILLFLLSLGLVAITAYRVPSTIARHSSQQFRSLLASLEILGASAVANAIVIGSFIRDRGVKKVKYRSQSISGNTLERAPTRTKSVAVAHWGSDEDLVRELGLSLHPTLQHRGTLDQTSRPAPVAPPIHDKVPTLLAEESVGGTKIDPNWNFANSARNPQRVTADSVSTMSDELKPKDIEAPTDVDAIEPVEDASSNKLSFFDVGGLIENKEKKSTPPEISRESSTRDLATQKSNPPTSQMSKHGSRAFLSDIGGLLSSHREEGDDDAADTKDISSALPTRIARRSNKRPSLTGGDTSFRAAPEEPTSKEAQGPEDLVFSDAGGLLK